MAKEEKKYYWHGKKSVCLGVLVFLLGLLWYLKDTGYITYAYLWQIVVMSIGVLLVLKGIVKAFMR